MADSRAVLVGTGVVLLVLGFFVSNLVCGVGLLFIILGLVIWQREEDDTKDYAAEASPAFLGARRRQRRRHAILAVLAAVIVVVVGLFGFLLYRQLVVVPFTGVRISAPDGDCWSGTVGSGASSNGANVGSCGSQSWPLVCSGAMWVNLTKTTPGNWTLTVSAYHDDALVGTNSASGNLGVVRAGYGC